MRAGRKLPRKRRFVARLAPHGIFADVTIGVREYWHFIVAPGGASDAAAD